MIWILIVIAICVLDQLSKYLVIQRIPVGDSVTVIQQFFYLNHIKNEGAAMGIFQNGRMILIPITILISIMIGYYMYKNKNTYLRLTLSFILGGAIGNLIDRIFKGGSVTDFLDFHLGPITIWKYIFNIADVFVVIGTILLAIYLLFLYKEKEKPKES